MKKAKVEIKIEPYPKGGWYTEEMFRFKLSTSVDERIWRFHILHTSSK